MHHKSQYPELDNGDRKDAGEILVRTLNHLATATSKAPPAIPVEPNRASMSYIFITCPVTKRPVQTAFEISPSELERHWDKHSRVECPHCGENHTFVVRQAFVASVLSDHGWGDPGTSDLISELKAQAETPPSPSASAKTPAEPKRPRPGRQRDSQIFGGR